MAELKKTTTFWCKCGKIKRKEGNKGRKVGVGVGVVMKEVTKEGKKKGGGGGGEIEERKNNVT